MAKNWVWKAKKEEPSSEAQAKFIEEERKKQERRERIRSAAADLMEAVEALAFPGLSVVWPLTRKRSTCRSRRPETPARSAS